MTKKPLTRKGFTRLAEEYNYLLNVERPKVVDGIATAAAEGDRSENAEYIYGKKRLREIDKRLRYLTNLLDNIRIIDPETLSGDTVCFGATVKLKYENGTIKQWMIVGEGEGDINSGSISWNSPMAKALIGKKVGDHVIIDLPENEIKVEIIELLFL